MYNVNLSTQTIIILLIIVTFILIVLLYSNKGPKNQNLKETNLSINGESFIVEIADNSATRGTGLMNRKSLDQNRGMLFVFDKTFVYPFWMKNTYIPLDIVWLNENKEVVYIKRDAKPCKNTINALCKSIVPTKPAKYVVEFNSGIVDQLDISEGNKVDFDL